MFTIESGQGRNARLPFAARLGFVVLVFGVVEDLAAHSLDGGSAVGGHTATELLGHLIVFVGMVLILLGVVVDGARQAIARRTSARRSSKGVA